MNIFFRVGDTLLTAPTSDRILDGITRKSILKLAELKGLKVEVRNITVKEIVEAAKNGTLLEMFGTGTAAVINPIKGFGYQEKDYELPEVKDSYATMFKQELTAIQQNKAEDVFNWRYQVREN